MKKINIACDLDGTLSAESSGNLWEENENPSLEFLEQSILKFKPKDGVDILNEFNIKPVIITGRPERLRPATSEWLWDNNIPCKKLVMYPDHYYPAGFEVNKYVNTKLKFHKLHFIDIAFDDTESVVDLLNRHGIKTYHVNEDFRIAFEKAMEEYGTYC